MWKVIIIDNFGNELVSDRLHMSGLTEEFAKECANNCNDAESSNSPNFYKAVPEEYELYDATKNM